MSAKVTSVAEFAVECQMKGIKGFVAINVNSDAMRLLKFQKIPHTETMHQLALCDLVKAAEGCYSEVVQRSSEPQYYSIYINNRVGNHDGSYRSRLEVCDIREIIKRSKQTIKEMNEQIESHEDFLDTWCDEEEE